jgi:hypothetical protein
MISIVRHDNTIEFRELMHDEVFILTNYNEAFVKLDDLYSSNKEPKFLGYNAISLLHGTLVRFEGNAKVKKVTAEIHIV